MNQLITCRFELLCEIKAGPGPLSISLLNLAPPLGFHLQLAVPCSTVGAEGRKA